MRKSRLSVPSVSPWFIPALLLATATAIADPLVIGQQPTGKLPFTLGPATTVITEPLTKDGLPDYAAALNARYGKDVTPDNNGFVLFLKVMGDSLIYGTPEERAVVLKHIGASPGQPTIWEPAPAWTQRRTAQGKPPAADVTPQLTTASQSLWDPKDLPDVADFLKDHEPLLALAQQAAAKPRFFLPVTDNTGSFGHPPRLVGISELFRALSARANQRAAANDFDGFHADTLALLRLADHFGNAPWLIERLLATVALSDAAAVLENTSKAHKFTAQQWQQLAAETAAPGNFDVAEGLDVGERYLHLQGITRMATALYKKELASSTDATDKRLAAIDPATVDWDFILENFNADYDQEVRAMHAPPGPARAAITDPLQAKITAAKKITDRPPAGPDPRTANTHWMLAFFEQAAIPKVMADRDDALLEARRRIITAIQTRLDAH
jgi:hypothetical protein